MAVTIKGFASDWSVPEPAKPGLNAIVDAKANALAPGQAGRLVSTMSKGVDDAVLVVLGDSTGNEPTEWVYRVVTWLGQQFPKYTVNYRLWDHATQAYSTATALQTGTTPRVLTVYNGSHPGASFDYATDVVRFPKLIPVTPTAVVISYGYNSTGPTYRYQQMQIAERVLGAFPAVEYALTAQPPKAPTDADANDHLRRQEDTRSLAMSERWGLIDATRPFVDRGDYSTLIHADGIHPTEEGSGLWLEQVKQYFGGHRQAQTPVMPSTDVTRIVAPSALFTTYVGTPTQGTPAGIIVPQWQLKPDEDGMLVGIVDVPPSWRTVDVQIFWGSPSGATGAVMWRLDWYAVSNVMHIDSGKPYQGATAGTPQTVNVAGGMSRVTRMYQREAFAGGRPLAFRVSRLGTNAADTSPQDAWFHGLVIRRAE